VADTIVISGYAQHNLSVLDALPNISSSVSSASLTGEYSPEIQLFGADNNP
jgi:hypothetical protein